MSSFRGFQYLILGLSHNLVGHFEKLTYSVCTHQAMFFCCSYHIASKNKKFSSTSLGVALPYLDIIYHVVVSSSSTHWTGKCPPWCHCRLPEGEYSEISNVWVHARREAPFWADNKAPETVAEGPGAQPEGARVTTEGSRPCRQVLGFLSGAQEPVETLREYWRKANAKYSASKTTTSLQRDKWLNMRMQTCKVLCSFIIGLL